jgi:hypothetical protein
MSTTTVPGQYLMLGTRLSFCLTIPLKMLILPGTFFNLFFQLVSISSYPLISYIYEKGFTLILSYLP